jgi:hypothetical protein
MSTQALFLSVCENFVDICYTVNGGIFTFFIDHGDLQEILRFPGFDRALYYQEKNIFEFFHPEFKAVEELSSENSTIFQTAIWHLSNDMRLDQIHSLSTSHKRTCFSRELSEDHWTFCKPIKRLKICRWTILQIDFLRSLPASWINGQSQYNSFEIASNFSSGSWVSV